MLYPPSLISEMTVTTTVYDSWYTTPITLSGRICGHFHMCSISKY